MIGDTLLDSSPSRDPVLRGRHWLITLAVGVVGFCVGYVGLPFAETPELRVLITQSTILGVMFFFFALMLVYVYADTRHLGLSTWLWVPITFVFNLVGFIAYLMYSAAKTGNWKRATLPIAYIIEVVVIGVMVIVPLIYTEALPKAQLMTFLVAPPPPPPPPPPPAAAPKVVVRQVSMADLMKAPTVIPKTIAKIKDAPISASVGVQGGVAGGVPGGQMGGVLGGIIGGVMAAGPPPPPPPPKPTAPQRIRVGGNVELAKRIYAPMPEYPALAKMARIQGSVRLEAVIAKDGTIKDLKVIDGHPLLVKAALAAVQQWRYQPTLLNGQAVEVQTEIDVNFTLAD
ncbi:MAG TPA: energy transducer TonB [Terriglobia bacterium]|nr:energy transducer TonB [Terriglobia bacterium]